MIRRIVSNEFFFDGLPNTAETKLDPPHFYTQWGAPTHNSSELISQPHHHHHHLLRFLAYVILCLYLHALQKPNSK